VVNNSQEITETVAARCQTEHAGTGYKLFSQEKTNLCKYKSAGKRRYEKRKSDLDAD